jgi:phage recombination protein Bet
MTTEIAAKEKHELITKDSIKEYLKSFGMTNSLNETEQNQFIEIAHAFQLNPFKREVYCVPYMQSYKDDQGNWLKRRALSIITGYETYLKRAERLGMLSGWNVITEGEGAKMKAVITIYRKDWNHPFVHEVYFREYNQENKMWKDKPITMLKKVATAQGFRLAFPDEFGGLPYTADELPEIMSQVNHIEPEKQIEQKPEPEPAKQKVAPKAEQKKPAGMKATPDAIKKYFADHRDPEVAQFFNGLKAPDKLELCNKCGWDVAEMDVAITQILLNQKPVEVTA